MAERISILLIDDDLAVLDVLCRGLLGMGYNVEGVGCAADALSRLRAKRYQLVIADAKLPDGSGVAIADQAKSRGIPAVILTGYAPETRLDGPQHDYLFKPIRADALAVAIEKYAAPV